jgi:DNA-binding helix-turn-helix protein
MYKNPLQYECIARDFLLYVITIQVAMVPLNWLPYCGGKELLLWIVESEVSMTYDIVCSETQSEKAIQHLGVLILLWRRHYHITQQELAKRTGLLQSYISGLEKGNIDPRISTLCRIVNGFDNMPLDTFFGGPDLGFIDFHGIEHRHIEFH